MSPDPSALPGVCHPCADVATQAQTLAQQIATELRDAVAARGTATLAVSGGKSPVLLFQALSAQTLPWSAVTVLLVDERGVPDTHPDSNARLVQAHLLQGHAAQAQWHPFFSTLPTGPLDPSAPSALDTWVTQACAGFTALAEPLDVVVLGMGEDGHTASLFPGAPGLEQALHTEAPLAWVCPVTAPHPRLTLSLPRLLNARHVHLPLAGARKASVLAQASQGPDLALPISLVLHQRTDPVHIWLAP